MFIRKNKNWFILGIVLKIILSVSFIGIAQNQKRTTEEIKIKTSAICEMCKDRIEKGLAWEKGVKDVSLNLETKIVTVKYRTTKTTPEKIRLAISKLGYDADGIPADTKAYEKLPSCCKKGNAAH